ncbi:hypothetical protein D3C78_1359210 [compost metagenome]
MLVANLTQSLQVGSRCRIDATLALHRFNQHCDNARRLHRGLTHGFNVIIGNAQKSRYQRLETALHGRVAGGRKRRQGASMKTVFHYQHLWLDDFAGIAMQPGKLERRFVGFGAGVTEKRPLHTRQFAQALAQLFLPLNAEHVGGMQQLASLLGNGRGNLGVCMTETGYRHAGNCVQVLDPLHVPKARALTSTEQDGLTCIGLHEVRR